MSEKKKISDLLKGKEIEKIEKKIIDSFFYTDDMKKEIEKIEKKMEEKCLIELYKEDGTECKAHLKGNPFSLLFNLYVLEDTIKKEYEVPEVLDDIIKLIKNDYSSEVCKIK